MDERCCSRVCDFYSPSEDALPKLVCVPASEAGLHRRRLAGAAPLEQEEAPLQCLPDLAPCRSPQQCCSGSCRFWSPHVGLHPRPVCLPKPYPTAATAAPSRRRLAGADGDGMPHGHRPCKRAEEPCSEHSECCSWLCVADWHGTKTCEPMPM